MCVDELSIEQRIAQGCIPKTTMEIHIRGGWARVHNRGIVMWDVIYWIIMIIGVMGWISYFHPLNR